MLNVRLIVNAGKQLEAIERIDVLVFVGAKVVEKKPTRKSRNLKIPRKAKNMYKGVFDHGKSFQSTLEIVFCS